MQARSRRGPSRGNWDGVGVAVEAGGQTKAGTSSAPGVGVAGEVARGAGSFPSAARGKVTTQLLGKRLLGTLRMLAGPAKPQGDRRRRRDRGGRNERHSQ